MKSSMSNIPKKIARIDDLRNQKSVQDNELITSVAKMDKVPLKIFELAVSFIDTENPPENNVVYLSKETIYSFFDVSSSNKHTRFKEALNSLHRQSVFSVREMNEKGKFEYKIISPVESSSWNDYNDVLQIQFTNSIMPYLINLKKNFTQYVITDIMELNSKYSIILYKWFSMNYNQYETYNSNGNRSEKQLEKLKNPYTSIEELRVMTDTEKMYERMSNFEARILKPAQEEISEHTHFEVTYEKIKRGRSVVGIKFYLDKKLPKSPYPYKENDPVYLEEKASKERNLQALFAEAIQSPYTMTLGENGLIGFRDMQDIELMADLQRQVFPLYDELKEKLGMRGVIEHIVYVSSHRDGYTEGKHNIVKYLKVSIQQYLTHVDIYGLGK